MLFSGNGFHGKEWWAKGDGAQMQLGQVLQPLRDFRSRMLFVRGLRHVEASKGNIHSSHLSWSSPTTPTPLEVYPALAFATDTTRIVSLKLNNDHSSLRFPHLGVDSMIHHLLSHSDTADWLKVNRFFVEQLACICRRLDAIQEGARTALDNTMLLYGSSMRTGNHDNDQLPLVVLGGGGGRIRGGRCLDYRAQPQRQMCRLLLSMMTTMGVALDRFGDATEKLAEF